MDTLKKPLVSDKLTLTQMTIISPSELPNVYEAEVGTAQDEVKPGFTSLTHQKRFHALFYTLAAMTGILVVQVLWQIAVFTAQ